MHKLNISEKGKSWKIEIEPETLSGRPLGDKVNGKEISPDLEGFELEITGATDFAGFAHKKDVEGTELRRVLLKDGWGMHKRPRKEGKRKVQTPHGLRLRKSVRGNVLSEKTIQINLNVIKPGPKNLKEIFPDQNKESEKPASESDTTQTPVPVAENTQSDTNTTTQKNSMESKEEIKEEIAEEIADEVKEEIKDDIPESPETETEEEKEEAAEKVADEVKEEVEEAAEDIAEEEKSN